MNVFFDQSEIFFIIKQKFKKAFPLSISKKHVIEENLKKLFVWGPRVANIFTLRRPETNFLNGLLTNSGACVKRKRVCYAVLNFYTDMLPCFIETNH